MGGAPRRSTVEQCASAMGLDAGHMGFDRMAKAIPPAYASFAFGQMVRYVLRARYGLTVPSFDEARRDWPGARRQMQFWRRGAGGTSPALGLGFEPVTRSTGTSVQPVGGGEVAQTERGPRRSGGGPDSGPDAAESAAGAAAGRLDWVEGELAEVAVREIDLS